MLWLVARGPNRDLTAMTSKSTKDGRNMIRCFSGLSIVAFDAQISFVIAIWDALFLLI
jgi:hypothetical protein